jgi:hypothetical protein
MNESHRRILEDISQAVVQTVNPTSIYVTGSLARGDEDRYSDVDVKVFAGQRVTPAVVEQAMENIDTKVAYADVSTGRGSGTLQFWTSDGLKCEVFLLAASTMAGEQETHAAADHLKVYPNDDTSSEAKEPQVGKGDVKFRTPSSEKLKQSIIKFWKDSFTCAKLIHRKERLAAYRKYTIMKEVYLCVKYASLVGHDMTPENVNSSTYTYRVAFDKLYDSAADEILGTVGRSVNSLEQIHRSGKEVNRKMFTVGSEMSSQFEFQHPEGLARVTLDRWDEIG